MKMGCILLWNNIRRRSRPELPVACEVKRPLLLLCLLLGCLITKDTIHFFSYIMCMCVGAASRSFTSTAVNVVTRNERQKVRVERNPTKKGYMRLHTNLGDLNLELHCDLAPRTCENFFVLSEGGYYTDTIFHRSIKNFMIQVWLRHCTSSSLSLSFSSRVKTLTCLLCAAATQLTPHLA